MSLDIDRPINRAAVVGCAISATRNYLKLHMSRTLKVLLCNTHAETRKLWKRSAGVPPLEAIPVDQFTGRADIAVASPARRAYHRERARPHSARCLAGAQLPATSCLGAFWTPVS